MNYENKCPICKNKGTELKREHIRSDEGFAIEIIIRICIECGNLFTEKVI